jgi:hypothetical protein
MSAPPSKAFSVIDLEFEDDGADTVTLQAKLDALDLQISRARFESRLVSDEILEELSRLMNERNNLFDSLQTAKAKAFQEFLATLQLEDLKVSGTYAQAGRRCQLTIQDPRIAQPQMPEAMKKKWKAAFHHEWQVPRKEFLRKRKEQVHAELTQLKSQKSIFTLPQMARKTRLELEFSGIEQELKG